MTVHHEPLPDWLPAGYINAAVYTSPHATPDLDPEPALLALINSAQESLHFAIYSLTLPDVAQAIIAKHNAGVAVQGVGDSGTWGGSTSQFPALVAAGVDVRKWGAMYRLMHDKVAVVDGNVVAIGSYNWTTQAERSNIEVLVIAHGTQTARVLAPTLLTQIQNAYQQGVQP